MWLLHNISSVWFLAVWQDVAFHFHVVREWFSVCCVVIELCSWCWQWAAGALLLINSACLVIILICSCFNAGGFAWLGVRGETEGGERDEFPEMVVEAGPVMQQDFTGFAGAVDGRHEIGI